jgi:phi13 family phage major tail protein
VLGMTKDSTTGALFETASDTPKEFALLWQFELAGGDETGKRTVLYRCTASRPSLAGETKESGITVDTNTVTITAMPRISDDMVKASATSDATAYSNWFSKVVEKGATA